MKYLIFGCMLILLGIAAMKHESPAKNQFELTSGTQISKSLSDENPALPPGYMTGGERALAKFTSYPMMEPDTQLQVTRLVEEGG